MFYRTKCRPRPYVQWGRHDSNLDKADDEANKAPKPSSDDASESESDDQSESGLVPRR
jgi:hypothetical protein